MKTDTLFYHGMTIDGIRFTIAGKFHTHNFNDLLSLGASICGAKEQFSKKLGRIKAEGRMKGESYKGHAFAFLYSSSDFTPTTENDMFTEDWFVGQEVKVFVDYCLKFEFFTSKQLKRHFSLHC